MEIDFTGRLLIIVSILSLIPVIAGVIKRNNEAEERRLQEIRWVREKEEEKRFERLLEIEKDALEEWMNNNDDASDNVLDEDSTTFTFEERTNFEDVRANYPKLTGWHEAGYLETTGLDSSDALNQGNGFMLYIIVKINMIFRLKSLKPVTTYELSSKYPDGLEVFTVRANTPEEEPKKRSRRISQKVKDSVWNRDGGKCVECDSNENLEFDHIIPHSKGGANTYRNIQLLCQDCNRTKSAKIG